MSQEKNMPVSLPPVEEGPNKAAFMQILTPRELEVLQLLARGLTNLEIGKQLFISKHTVKNHVSNIYRKLNVDDRTQIALLAIRNGLVVLD